MSGNCFQIVDSLWTVKKEAVENEQLQLERMEETELFCYY